MECHFGIIWTIVSMLTMIFEIYGLQQFIEKPQDLEIIKGQTAVMRCAVENRVGKIQWGKGTTSVVLLGYDLQIPGSGGRYSIRANNSKENNLQIVNVSLDDDDCFQCQVGPADNNTALLAKAYLKVLVPPNMPTILDYINGSVVEVAYTQPLLKLICTSTNGRPAATLKWLRNGVEITDQAKYVTEPIPNDKRENARNTLTLSPKYPDDNGVYYTCEARSVALANGSLKAVVVLSVLYPPGQPVITGYKVNQVAHVGDTINLICTAEGGNPLAEVKWFRNDVQLNFSYTQRNNKAENELIITAEQSDNDAQYRCEAWNRVNADTPLNDTWTLNVHFAPKSAIISGTLEGKTGETLTLTCTTTNSNPAAVITWIPSGASGPTSHSHIESSPEGGFITISEINITLTNQQTNALYKCSAANHEVGVTVSDSVTVGVLYPPEAPEVTGYTDSEYVRAGNLVTMKCTALKGNPPASLKWFKFDQEVTDVTDLTVGNIPAKEINIVAKADDNGVIYRCEASNKATETPLVVQRKLTVYFPPASVNITSDPTVGRAGKQLRLTCITASSNPAAEITWIQSTRHLSGLNLEMTNASNRGKSLKNVLEFLPSSADNGLAYNCRATNPVIQEMINDAITLTILYKPEFVNVDGVILVKVGEGRMVNLSARANPDNSNYTLRHGEELIDAEHHTLTLDAKGILTITAIAKEHAGLYTIYAMNSEGQTSFDFRIDVLSKPGPPYEIEVVNKTHNSITVKWKPGFDGGMTQAFRVWYKELDTATAGFIQADVLPKDSTAFTITDLSVGTNYEIRVMAYNELGGSDYSLTGITEKTSILKPVTDVQGEVKPTDDKPVIIILVVCIVGIVLLALNIGLILLCVRRRRKRMENGSDTTSNTNTIQLYSTTKDTQQCTMGTADESRSYDTYEKSRDDDNFSDEFKSYEGIRQDKHLSISVDGCTCLGKATSWKDNCCLNAGDEDIKHVFLPSLEYGQVTYSHNNLDSPTFDHIQPVLTECKFPCYEDHTDFCRKSPWQGKDAYWSNRGKGTFERGVPGYNGNQYEHNGSAGKGRSEPRPKSITTESSELSSEPSIRGGYLNTPPPSSIRTSSKGTPDTPPLPARNYGSQDHIPRYVPFPGSSTLNSNANVIPNPIRDGLSIGTYSPMQALDPTDDMRGYLV